MVGRGLRRGVAALLAALVWAGPLAAWSQSDAPSATPAAFPAFPQGGGFDLINQWLADNTNLTAKQIVLVSAEAAFAFVGAPPTSPGLVAREVREEALSQPIAEAMGGRSAILKLEFDCRLTETTVSEVVVYPGTNLSGDDSITVPAGRWLGANRDFDMSDLATVACGKGPQSGADLPSQAAAAPPPAPVPYQAVAAEPAPRPRLPTPRLPTPRRPPPGPAPTAARWAQIGAFADADIAQQLWVSLKRGLPESDQGLTLRIEPVAHGAGTLQRALVGPFADGTEAEAFCARIKTTGFGCLIR